MRGLTCVVCILVLTVACATYPCGPDGLCTCNPVSERSGDLKMDCSRTSLPSICDICNSSVMQNVTDLDVSGNYISSIEGSDCMTGCQKLQFLDLHNNRITRIEETVFATIHGLTYLDVSSNKLNVYTKEEGKVFQHLIHLRTLKLNDQSGPNMYSYPDLSTLTSLENLTMDGLRDSTFDSSFSKLTHLTGLFMSGLFGKCDLGELHNDSFQYLSRIETLSLPDCNISNIDLLTFALPNLRQLDLSRNRRLGFETLHNLSYSLQFTHIEILDFSYVFNTFGIGQILRKHNICFLWNTTLREFSLNGNRLESIETNVPILFPKTMDALHIDDNWLRFGLYMLQVGCISNMKTFTANYLRRDQNPQYFFEEHVFPAVRDIYNGSMDCPYMQDEYIKNIGSGIPGCRYINDTNPRRILPTPPKTLRNVSITNSKLQYATDDFFLKSGSSDVKVLNMSGNFFCPWNGPVPFLINLEVLDLSNNGCDKVNSLFLRENKDIVNLQLGQNSIGVYEENMEITFQNLPHLKVLNLSDNKIETVPSQALYGLYSLETLDLSVNFLRGLELDVQMLHNLTTVILNNNLIEALPDALTSHLVKVSEQFRLDLRNNHLRYSCKYEKFLHWIVQYRQNIVGFDDYKFFDDDDNEIPVSAIESRITQLRTKCRKNTVWIVLSSVGVTLSLCVIVGGLVYRNRWKLRYFLYMSKQRFYGYVRVPDEAPIENFKYSAFVSYADEVDLRFIRDEFIPNVEQNGISLCVHQRDFLPGNTIADNIVDAIQSSRKTVVLLSKAFLKRKWCMYEFNMARMENIYSRDERGCLMIVMLESVPAKDMPLDMLNFIRKESYIEYTSEPEGQVVFWDKLRQSITA